MANEDGDNGSSGGSNKLILGMLVLNMIVLGGVGAIVFMDQKQKDAAQSIEKLAEGATKSDSNHDGGGHGEAAGGHGEAGGHGGEGQASKAKTDVRFFNVGEFTANLSGSPGSAHFIRVNVNLELDALLEDEEMKKRSPQVRDKIITLLNSKRPQDLQNRDGRKFLKKEIQTAINSFLETGKVVGVYFSTFVFE